LKQELRREFQCAAAVGGTGPDVIMEMCHGVGLAQRWIYNTVSQYNNTYIIFSPYVITFLGIMCVYIYCYMLIFKHP